MILALALASPARAAEFAPILPIREVKAGQHAVVRTVFEGARVDTFSAEIVGVIQGGRAEGNFIVARATSERVRQTGIAQGMSGSPVYVDGKLVGALSSGWAFIKEPLFGVTPIEEMMDVWKLPERAAGGPSAGPSGAEAGGPRSDGWGGAGWGEFRWWSPEDREPASRGTPASLVTGLRPLAVPLACVGLHPAALEAARPFFERLGLNPVPAGAARGGGPKAEELVPGAAFAVDLVRGDVHLAAIGTVTHREGDRVLGFGHPFLQAGDVSLPLSTAEILTIVPSQLLSFKLGAPGRPVGTLLQDRRAAVAGRVGPQPRLLPVSVEVRGVRPAAQRFRYEVIEDRLLAPQLVGIAASSSFFESGGSAANQSLRWQLQIHARGLPPLTLTDGVASDALASDAVGQVRGPLDFLFNNPYERLRLDSLAVRLEVEPGRDLWALRNARLERPAVRPGQDVVLRYEIERYRGVTETREMRLAVPAELSPQDEVTVWVGGGAELMRFEAQRLPARYRPTSLQDAWRRLAAYRSTDGVYAVLATRAAEVTAAGKDLPGLPPSAQAVLTSPQRRGDDARTGRVTLLGEVKQLVRGVVRGELQLPLTVDPQAP
jgi:hypothetical protein